MDSLTFYLGPLEELLDAVVHSTPIASGKVAYLKEQRVDRADFNTRAHIRLSVNTINYGDFAINKPPVIAFVHDRGSVQKYILKMLKITTHRPVQTFHAGGGNPVGYSMPVISETELEATAISIPLTQPEKFMCNVHNIKYPDWREMKPDEDPTRR